MEKKLTFMKNIMRNFGVKMIMYNETLSGLENYDDGLRSRLFKTHNTGRLEEFIRSIEPAVLYLTEDPFGCHYCFFSILDHTLKPWEYCGIGPWLENDPEDADINYLLEKKLIPHYLKPELVQYFHNIPIMPFGQRWESILAAFADYLYDEENKFSIRYLKFDPDNPDVEYSPQQDSFLSMHLLEDLYNSEDILLEAITAGDTKRALQWLANASHYRPPQRAAEKTRDSKSYLLVLNTLCRKAVQNSSVHPIHIHAVSTDFARRIEKAQSAAEINSLVEAMIRSYCALVQNHSLAKFSAVLRKAINFIEFNLKEPLTLSILAKQFNIDPSNLSHHFTRETGMTLTEYINGKRLEHARHLLTGSGLYVQEAAEQSGFQDVNYFIRLFKRKYGKTPGEYRKEIREGI
jgi:AraC-like DNA-binding protein